MDFGWINWAWFALAVSGLLLAAWIVGVVRAKPGPAAGIVGFAHLLVAGMNSAAPVRGYVDPDYVGYGFGLLAADRGLAVTVTAGAVWLTAVLGAFLSLSVNRIAMALAALTSAAFTVVIGLPLAQGALADPAANTIQFGEYLTIPGVVATVLMIALLALPFAFGVVWAGRRVLRG